MKLPSGPRSLVRPINIKLGLNALSMISCDGTGHERTLVERRRTVAIWASIFIFLKPEACSSLLFVRWV